MVRTAWIALIFLFIAVTYLFVLNMKDAYKILPMDSKPFDQKEDITSDWLDYQDPSGRFKVKFPVIPQYAQDVMQKEVRRVYDMYVAETLDGTIFMITLITFSKLLESQEDLLRKVAQEMQSSDANNRLRALKSGLYKGALSSLDFVIENAATTIRTKAIFVEKTMIVLTQISRSPQDRGDEFKAFEDSFEIL